MTAQVLRANVVQVVILRPDGKTPLATILVADHERRALAQSLRAAANQLEKLS